MEEYHKIIGIFERDHNTKKLIEEKYTNETIEYLKDNVWEFTEKIDGTNIRIMWDGHKVSFYGRTDKAQMPVELSNRYSSYLEAKLMNNYLNKNLEQTQ